MLDVGSETGRKSTVHRSARLLVYSKKGELLISTCSHRVTSVFDGNLPLRSSGHPRQYTEGSLSLAELALFVLPS